MKKNISLVQNKPQDYSDLEENNEQKKQNVLVSHSESTNVREIELRYIE